MQSPNTNDDLVYRAYVVAVLDIMGHKEAIRRLDAFQPNSEDKAELIRLLRDSIGARNDVLDKIKLLFEAVTRKPDTVGTPVRNAEQQEAQDLVSDSEVKTYCFSDTLVAYSPLILTEDHPRVSAILGMLAGCAAAMLTAIAEGTPVRGAIEVGFGLEPQSSEVYGPAFLAAYELEQNVAHYPRIVVGHKLASCLQELAGSGTTLLRDKAITLLARGCLQLIGRDEDGCPFVDYLGDGARQIIGARLSGEALVEGGLNFAKREQARFIQEKNPKLAGRYAALRRYYEAKIPAWRKGVDPS